MLFLILTALAGIGLTVVFSGHFLLAALAAVVCVFLYILLDPVVALCLAVLLAVCLFWD